MTIPVEKAIGRWMKDPAFKAEYDALGPEFALAEVMIKARKEAGLSQAEVAERMGIAQPNVARLESGRASPTFATLLSFGKAVGKRLVVAFESEVLDAPRSRGRTAEPRVATARTAASGRSRGGELATARARPAAAKGPVAAASSTRGAKGKGGARRATAAKGERSTAAR
jgi:transcriptional regulator with XRE-family HTH domain